MTFRAPLAALSLAVFVAACQSDRTAAPVVATGNTASHATIPAPPDAAPASFVTFPSIYITGSFTPSPTGTVAPAAPANFDRTFHITTSDPSLLPDVPATLTLPANGDRTSFAVTPSHAVSVATNVTLTATGAGASVSTVMTFLPPGSPDPAKMLDTIFATPVTVPAGSPSTATIRLTQPAPAGGAVVGLSTKLPLSASMPPTVFVPAGQRVVTVPITTFIGFPNSTTSVQISAVLGATVVANGVNVVTGNVTPPLSLNPVKLNAPLVNSIATVVGGTALTGVMSLNAPAPAGGAFIVLVSTDTTVATVPASVTIPAGGTSATFPITTKVVAAPTSSNVGGGFNGGFLVATLDVLPPSSTTPPPNNPPPASLSAPSLVSPAADARFAKGSTVNFDWSDVSGAASYTIQISDNDKFQSTLVSQTVTASQFTSATLPAKTLWWRVRSNSASGSSSGFTSARRFELK
ncbi:MAG TPA: hypothetical protein VGM82_03570 [Gemmatimonadaceae bacterium]|jgi:hypothetical protein